MAEVVHVKINWYEQELASIKRHFMKGLFRIGFDIASQARRNAPYVTGALRSTIRVEETSSNTIQVIAGGSFGGKVVDYAWKREQGPNRVSSTEHYMENAAKSIMVGNYIQKYFGDITK